MTGLELLKQEMIKRGANKTMTESKTVCMVLDILANAGTVYSDIQEASKQLDNLRKQLDDYRQELNARARELSDLRARRSVEYQELQRAREAFEKERDEAKSYIEKFNASLENMESEEARDRLRTAQVYVNSVDIKTAYDNTAFINWFGAILAGDKTGGIESFKKINPESVYMYKQKRASTERNRRL